MYDQQTITLPFDISRFAVASIGTRYFAPDLHFSTSDQFASSRLAFSELRKLGYSRIGYVNRLPIEQIVQHRFLGGFLAAGHLEPSSWVTPLVTDDYTDFGEWFRATKPDAIISIETTSLKILRGMGVDVPGRVAFAHLNCQNDASGNAGVVQNNDKVAAAAVELVVNQISHNQRGAPAAAKGVLVEGRWQPGVTAPPVRKR
jgi:DNA-binding LacI/PurR family transcriptional regulator